MSYVTVVMPVYNGEKYVQEAVESVLRQTYRDFELLIINDGSSDSTPHILSELEKADGRIKVIHNEQNLRLIATLNKGLNLATGKYIVRMDADDICHPERFRKQVDFMETHGYIGICGSWVNFFGHENKVLRLPEEHEEIRARLLFKPPVIHPSVIIRRSVLEEHDLRYREELLHAEDFGLWVEAAMYTKLGNIPEVLLDYRLSENNISKRAFENVRRNDIVHKKIYEKTFIQWGMAYTEEDLAIHRLISSNDASICNETDVRAAIQWLKKLKAFNKERPFYDETALAYSITVSLLSVIKRVSYLDKWGKIKCLLANSALWNIGNLYRIIKERI